MNRPLLSTALVASLLFGLSTGLLTNDGVQAHVRQVSHIKKVSADLANLVNLGHGGEQVRVIVQPASTWNSTIDFLLLLLGGRTTRRFSNLNFRVLTLSANAAMVLSLRNDIAH